jgi:hypothetical protein
MKKTVLVHMYNEEYLLPFWLEHHRKLFDHGIVLDYDSTDRSVEIVKEICPTWEVHTSRNKWFDPPEVDKEVMEYEKTVDGIKMTLNVTEFIFPKYPLEHYFEGSNEPKAFHTVARIGTAKEDKDPKTLKEFFEGIDSISVCDQRPGFRYIHSHPSGLYHIGRHYSFLESKPSDSIYLLWVGLYPWNERTLKRKMQIGPRLVGDGGGQHREPPEGHLRRLREAQAIARPIEKEEGFYDVFKSYID